MTIWTRAHVKNKISGGLFWTARSGRKDQILSFFKWWTQQQRCCLETWAKNWSSISEEVLVLNIHEKKIPAFWTVTKWTKNWNMSFKRYGTFSWNHWAKKRIDSIVIFSKLSASCICHNWRLSIGVFERSTSIFIRKKTYKKKDWNRSILCDTIACFCCRNVRIFKSFPSRYNTKGKLNFTLPKTGEFKIVWLKKVMKNILTQKPSM